MNINTFRDIFVPEKALWTYWLPESPSSPEGKYSKEPHLSGKITDEIIQNHLDGKMGIVLSPFCSEKKIKWAALDVDKDSLETVNKIYNELQKRDILPNIFRSKSNGYHLYIIFNNPVSAKLTRIFLEDVLRTSGVSCEIFPKQDTITEKGGSKIHLPFFGDIRKNVDMDGTDIEYSKTKNDFEKMYTETEKIKIYNPEDLIVDLEELSGKLKFNFDKETGIMYIVKSPYVLSSHVYNWGDNIQVMVKKDSDEIIGLVFLNCEECEEIENGVMR